MAMVMRKLKNVGTVSATWHENGISIGKYADKSIASLEEIDGLLTLLIHEPNCKELNCKIKYIQEWPK